MQIQPRVPSGIYPFVAIVLMAMLRCHNLPQIACSTLLNPEIHEALLRIAGSTLLNPEIHGALLRNEELASLTSLPLYPHQSILLDQK